MGRIDGRGDMELRDVKIRTGVMLHAHGSCEIRSGRTTVLCSAMIEKGVPPFLEGTGKGWLTAEYSMLPASCIKRKQRERQRQDSRGTEIQRLIGRSLRSVLDLDAVGENTIYIDCDVVSADGGTRTASITGAFVALCLCVRRALAEGIIKKSPVRSAIAAVSAGIVKDSPMLDLCYAEDSNAQADMNMVGTEDGGISEIQISGEKRPVQPREFAELVGMCKCGIKELIKTEKEALGDAADVIGGGSMKKLIIATGNAGKVREIKSIFTGLYDEVLSMKEAGIDADVEEDGKTFHENASKKAVEISRLVDCDVLADDSGLCVDALGGEPGIFSARYGGEHGDDDRNIEVLLEKLEDVPDDKRTAYFSCCMVLARGGKEVHFADGRVYGRILREKVGENGFGYDPVFFYEPAGTSFADMSADDKNAVSHRAEALRIMRGLIEDEQK